MMWSNRQILSAVLAKWGQPAVESLISTKMSGLPFLANIEAKIKSTGFVSPMWSFGREIAPLLNGISSSLIEPLLNRYLAGIPDEAIPQLAHNVVNDAVKNGSLSLFEGNIELEPEDLQELQTLLRYNLPIAETCSYRVITEDPEEEAEPTSPAR